MSYIFDQSTALTRVDDDTYSLNLDARFWNMNSAFGGWVAAICVAAVEARDDARGSVITHQMNFHAGVRDEQLLLRVRCIERRRSVDFWQVDVCSVAQPTRALASASIVCGQHEVSPLEFEQSMPAYRAVADCIRLPRTESTPSWFDHYEIRLAKGRPFVDNGVPHSVTYVRESDVRPIDAKALVSIADTPMPRTFFVSDAMISAATISLSTHIYASAGQLSEISDGYVMLDTNAAVIRHGFLNQQTAVYRADGLLLAMSYQTGRYRQ
ncbi:MAG: thioesterase family protein [Pseudomonadota bacterium]